MSKKMLNFYAISQEMNINSEDTKIFVDVVKLWLGHELLQLVGLKIISLKVVCLTELCMVQDLLRLLRMKKVVGSISVLMFRRIKH